MLVACFVMPFLLIGSARALRSNRNDVKDWLPDDYRETAVHRWFQKHFPQERFVLASWEGCTLDDPRLELLARKLETYDPDLEELGLSGQTAERLKQNGICRRSDILAMDTARRFAILSSEEARRVEQKASDWVSPFITPVLTGDRLVTMLKSRYPDLEEHDIFQRLEGSLLGADHVKTCLVVMLSEAAKGKKFRPTLEKIRRAAQQCAVEPVDPTPQGNLVLRAVDGAAGVVREMVMGREPVRGGLHLGGPPVDNVAIDVEGERTLARLAGLSALVGLWMSWLVFRSVRLTGMVFFTGILCAGTGLAVVFYSGGTCDAVLLSMPSLIYILAISGSIHIINYYHDAIRQQGLPGAPEKAVGLGWLPCTIAAVTTALGLGSLCVSHVVPISKFGIYSAVGVVTTLAWVFLFLPACLYFFPSRRYAEQHGCQGEQPDADTLILRVWRAAGSFVLRHNLLVSAGCLLAMGFFAAGIYRVETSVKLMKLFRADAPIVAHYTWLEKHLGPLVPMEVVVRVDNQKCKLSFLERMRLAGRVEQAVESLDAVGGALSAATFAPDLTPDKGPSGALRILGIDRRRTRDQLTNRRLKAHRDEFRDYLSVDEDAAVAGPHSDPTLYQLDLPEKLIERLQATGIETLAAVDSYGDITRIEGVGRQDVAAIAAAAETWRQSHPDPTLEELGITGPAAAALAAADLQTLTAIRQYAEQQDPHVSVETALAGVRGIEPEQAAQAAATVRSWCVAHGSELWRVSARVEALGDLDYGEFVSELKKVVEPLLAAYREGGVEGVEAVYTGVVPLVYKTQNELMEGLFESLALAFVLIAVVMVLVLRNPAAGLLAMVPNLFPVVVIFGTMGWLGILVDIGSMMTASVALGVAVDDTIHYLTWYRRGLDQGRDRKGAAMMAYERCASAMTQTTLIAGLGLAVFAFSSFTPTQRFGTLMLALLFAALVGDLVFLPSLLCGPIGRFFGGSRRRGRTPESPSLPASPQPAASAPALSSVPPQATPHTGHSAGPQPLSNRLASSPDLPRGGAGITEIGQE